MGYGVYSFKESTVFLKLGAILITDWRIGVGELGSARQGLAPIPTPLVLNYQSSESRLKTIKWGVSLSSTILDGW